MKFIKSLAIGVAAALSTALPGMAKVDNGTSSLIKALQESGIQVVVNPQQCDGSIHGSYRMVSLKRTMILCPGQSVDAVDHATVRHEAAHAIQHCVNAGRGTNNSTPVMDMDRLVSLVNTHLTEDLVTFVKENYQPDDWAVELEANLLENIATASELQELFLEACVAG